MCFKVLQLNIFCHKKLIKKPDPSKSIPSPHKKVTCFSGTLSGISLFDCLAHLGAQNNYELEKTIYLTGHSLGGAIAQIIGLWLDNAGYNVQIYTFGSPKVSTTFFGNRPIHYRVLVRNDPVPFVPPYPFLHSGISIDAETLDWEEGGEASRGSFGEIDGRDHSIVYYNRTLKERLKDGK